MWPPRVSAALRALSGTLFALAIGGCGEAPADDASSGGTASTSSEGGQGGASSAACPPGEELGTDGLCTRAGEGAGVPPELCATGFVPSEPTASCEPVLPSEPCPTGAMALPGDEVCRPVGSCGAEPWGDIELADGAVFVDAGYVGGDSDGTESRPWLTINDALGSVSDGGIIVVAAGSYAEDVRIEGRSVRIAGRCPSLVRVTGTGYEAATISVIDADAVELRGLAIDGPRAGVWLRNAAGALLEELYVAGSGHVGLAVRGGATAAIARSLLIESATGTGVLVSGAALEMEGAVIRDTRAPAAGQPGYGLSVQFDASDGGRGNLTARRIVVERSRGSGLSVLGADARIEGSVIRDTLVEAGSGLGGQAIQITRDAAAAERGALELVSSVVERSGALGILVSASDAQIDASLVRDTGAGAPEPGRHWGVAWIEDETSGELARGSLRRSVIERASEAALLAYGAEVEIDRCIVRDTAMGPYGWGRGAELAGSEVGPDRTHVTVSASRFEGNRALGIFVAGGSATIAATRVEGTQPAASGESGYGILVQDQPFTGERGRATIVASAVEDNINCGILASSADVTVEDTAVRRVGFGDIGDTGFGIQAQRSVYDDHVVDAGGALLVRRCQIADVGESAIALFGSTATVEDTDHARSAGNEYGELGDGITLVPQLGARSTATVSRCQLRSMRRAAIANFGGEITMTDSLLDCAPIPLAGEQWLGFSPTFVDGGGNECSCDGSSEVCAVRSSGLEPPEPLE